MNTELDFNFWETIDDPIINQEQEPILEYPDGKDVPTPDDLSSGIWRS